jgi:flagellar L-ring protein precursor FlgH
MTGHHHPITRALLLAGLAVLAGCAIDAPGKTYFVKPSAFPVQAPPIPDATNGTVFPADSTGSLYGNQRFWEPGDIVTVDVTLASTAAGSDAGTLNKDESLNASLSQFMGIPLTFGHANGTSFSPSFTTSNVQQFTGTGAVSGSSTVTTNIAAVVTSVQPNGVLELSGRTNVNIDGNVTGIVVTGYARPQDIGANNTISSDQLAQANIQYVGVGPLNSAHHVPWLEGIFSQYLPF